MSTGLERPELPEGSTVVAGLGKSGMAAIGGISAARPAGHIVAWDASSLGHVRDRARRLRRRGIETVVGMPIDAALDIAGTAAFVVRSPGIPWDAPPLLASAARGLPVFDELEVGWRLYRQPWIGITGTDGKGTTATFTAALLRRRISEVAVVGNYSHGPAASDARNAEAELIVCEVSSFQLECADAFLPEVAVLTNLTRTHIRRHGACRRYAATKARMFVRGHRPAPVSVINIDDPFGASLARHLRSLGGRVVSFGSDASADVRLLKCAWDAHGTAVVISAGGRRASAHVRLTGRHNAMNAVAAIATVGVHGIDLDEACAVIGTIDGPPARSQRIELGAPFDVFIDYAHTREGIIAVLTSLRTIVNSRPGARLLALTGPLVLDEGSDDPLWATPIVGEYADAVIVTTGHLSSMVTGPPIVVMAEMRRAGGVSEVILDRRSAIRQLVDTARPGDVLLVLARGDLSVIQADRAGTFVAFDDAAAVRDAYGQGDRTAQACR